MRLNKSLARGLAGLLFVLTLSVGAAREGFVGLVALTLALSAVCTVLRIRYPEVLFPDGSHRDGSKGVALLFYPVLLVALMGLGRLYGFSLVLLAVFAGLGLSEIWLEPGKRLLRTLDPQGSWLTPERFDSRRTLDDLAPEASEGPTPSAGWTARRIAALFAAFGIVLLVGIVGVTGVLHYSALASGRQAALIAAENAEYAPPPLPSLRSVTELDWQLQGLDGRHVTLSDFRGKVLIVNRWTSSNRSSVSQLLQLERLRQQVPPDQVAFLFVSLEELSSAREFAQRQRWRGLPLFVERGEAPGPLAFRRFPATFMVDRDGRVVFRYENTARWDDPAVVDFVMDLLESD